MDYVDILAAKGEECRLQIERLQSEIAILETKAKLIGELLALEHHRKPVSGGTDVNAGVPTKKAAEPVRPATKARRAGAKGLGKPDSEGKARNGTSLRKRILEICVEAIRKAGHPINRTALLEIVREAGLEPPGQHPPAYLSSMLSKAKNLKNVDGEGYMIVEMNGSDRQAA